MFIFHFVYTKNQVLLIYNENKEICIANLMRFFLLKALVNIVVDRFKKNRTVLADLYNYVQVDE